MKTTACIITSYNFRDYIGSTIESALHQTRPFDEIIVADDASSDGTQEIIEEYSAKYDNVRGIYRKNNLGIGTNKDLAIRSADTEYVTYLDGDDRFTSDKNESEWKLMETEKYDMVYSEYKTLRPDGTETITNHNHIMQLNRRDIMIGFLSAARGARRRFPRNFLISKTDYIRLGGMPHLLLFEDFALKISMIARLGSWAGTGKVGMVRNMPDSQFSRIANPVFRTLFRAIAIHLREREITDTCGSTIYRRALLEHTLPLTRALIGGDYIARTKEYDFQEMDILKKLGIHDLRLDSARISVYL